MDAARRAGLSAAAIASSSGNSAAASSHPRLSARVRNSPALSRPIRPERAISRVVSLRASAREPDGTGTSRSSRDPPRTPRAKSSQGSDRVRNLKTPAAPPLAGIGRLHRGRITPPADWPIYADYALTGICRRLWSGRYRSVADTCDAIDIGESTRRFVAIGSTSRLRECARRHTRCVATFQSG